MDWGNFVPSLHFASLIGHDGRQFSLVSCDVQLNETATKMKIVLVVNLSLALLVTSRFFPAKKKKSAQYDETTSGLNYWYPNYPLESSIQHLENEYDYQNAYLYFYEPCEPINQVKPLYKLGFLIPVVLAYFQILSIIFATCSTSTVTRISTTTAISISVSISSTTLPASTITTTSLSTVPTTSTLPATTSTLTTTSTDTVTSSTTKMVTSISTTTSTATSTKTTTSTSMSTSTSTTISPSISTTTASPTITVTSTTSFTTTSTTISITTTTKRDGRINDKIRHIIDDEDGYWDDALEIVRDNEEEREQFLDEDPMTQLTSVRVTDGRLTSSMSTLDDREYNGIS